MKAFRSTIILAVLLALVGGYIYWNERGPITGAGQSVLLRLPKENIASLRFTHSKQQLTLQRHDGGWQVRDAGHVAPADEEAVNQLLQQLQLLQTSVTLPNDDAKLQAYGLQQPQQAITVNEQQTIEFGNKPPVGAGAVYARVNNQVALLPASLAEVAAHSFTQWRDKAALRINTKNVTQFSIDAPALNATFVQVQNAATQNVNADSAAWKITQPLDAGAANEVVQSFVDALASTRAAGWLDEKPTDLRKWGLDKPVATVVVNQSNDARTLRVGHKLQQGYAAQNSLSDAVFVLPNGAFALLNRPMREWRSKRLAHFDLSQLNGIVIRSGGAQKTFIRFGEKWIQEGAPSGMAQDAANLAVLDILATSRDLTVQDFIDRPAPALWKSFEAPTLQLSFRGTPSQTIQLLKQNNRVLARSASTGEKTDGNSINFEPTLYVLSPEFLDAFQEALGVLFPKPKR
ncbi:MAG TPA: DUF4340 domain-containing protein [Abditibacteriaceae bacterium]|jgi:hypothetical protein